MEKKCSKCKQKLDVSLFNKNKRKKDGLNNYCRECNKIAHKEHYIANRQDYYNKNKSNRLATAAWLEEYKSTLKCAKCSENHPACLQFHHIDKTKKEFEISRIAGRTVRKLLLEIAKCEILCANCHFKLHYDEKQTAHSSTG